MTANVLDISHLTLSIEHKTILQDIDLTIGAGETVALIGESGSGKSTLAQCILGLQPQRSRLTPESRIDCLGEPLPIENDARMRRWRGCSISMIFQDPMSCLNPYLRVGTQILEALKRGSASDEDPHARMLELLEMVDLPEPKQTAGKYLTQSDAMPRKAPPAQPPRQSPETYPKHRHTRYGGTRRLAGIRRCIPALSNSP